MDNTTIKLRIINPCKTIFETRFFEVLTNMNRTKRESNRLITTKPFSPKLLISKLLKGLSSFEQLIFKQLKVVMTSNKRNIKNAK